MILAFLLIVMVDGEPLPNSSNWLFANVLTCNQAAHYVESGKTTPNGKGRNQKNISAYCVPKSVSKNTKLWY